MIMDNMLTLPTNIMAMIINLLPGFKLPVMPKLKPTVPYAEKHSNPMFSNPNSGSKIVMAIIPKPITINESEMVANALFTETSAISLLKTSIRLFPFAKLKMFKVAMANVLVLMPPPVDTGEAPIHIKRKVIMMVGKVRAAMSTELKPAVRGVAAPKSAVTIFPKKECPARVWLYSKTKNKIKATNVNYRVVTNVILLFMLSTHGR